MNNPFDYESVMNGYTNDGASVGGSEFAFRLETPLSEFDFAQHPQPLEDIDNFFAGSKPRGNLILEETSIALLFKNQRFNCRKTYEALEMFGYFLPSYRSRCITYNYLLGVSNKSYFGVIDQVRPYPHRTKLTSNVIFCELLKLVNVPLGYNSTNLPPRAYLFTLLFHLSPKHPFFESDVTKISLPLTEEGLFYVPVSCRGLIRVNKKRALIHSALAVRGGSHIIAKDLSKAASIICAVEDVKNRLSVIKSQLKNCPALEADIHMGGLTNLLDRIK